MKTRTRNTIVSTIAGSVQLNSQPPSTTAAVPYSAIVESIVSEDPKRKKSGYCKHSRVETRYYVADIDIVDSYGPTDVWKYRGGYLAHTCVYPRTSYLTGGVLIDAVDWGALSFDAMRAMRPTLNPKGLMLGAFAKELHVRNMRARWARFREELEQSGWKRYIMWRYHQIKNNIALLPRRAASLHLWYQFGLKPFVDDCFAIFRSLKTLEKRINDMISEAGKLRKNHWSRTLDTIKLPYAKETDVWFAGARGHHLFAKSEYVQRPVYHATLTYILDASELKGLLGTIRGFTSAMGLDRFLGTIWEIIPFSFLVDWFVDVSSFLDGLDDDLFGALPILILEYCDSVKYEYRTTCSWKFMVPPYNQVGRGATLAQHTVKYYERRNSTPVLIDVQSANGLTVKRTALAGSLLIGEAYRRRSA